MEPREKIARVGELKEGSDSGDEGSQTHGEAKETMPEETDSAKVRFNDVLDVALDFPFALRHFPYPIPFYTSDRPSKGHGEDEAVEGASGSLDSAAAELGPGLSVAPIQETCKDGASISQESDAALGLDPAVSLEPFFSEPPPTDPAFAYHRLFVKGDAAHFELEEVVRAESAESLPEVMGCSASPAVPVEVTEYSDDESYGLAQPDVRIKQEQPSQEPGTDELHAVTPQKPGSSNKNSDYKEQTLEGQNSEAMSDRIVSDQPNVAGRETSGEMTGVPGASEAINDQFSTPLNEPKSDSTGGKHDLDSELDAKWGGDAEKIKTNVPAVVSPETGDKETETKTATKCEKTNATEDREEPKHFNRELVATAAGDKGDQSASQKDTSAQRTEGDPDLQTPGEMFGDLKHQKGHVVMEAKVGDLEESESDGRIVKSDTDRRFIHPGRETGEANADSVNKTVDSDAVHVLQEQEGSAPDGKHSSSGATHVPLKVESAKKPAVERGSGDQGVLVPDETQTGLIDRHGGQARDKVFNSGQDNLPETTESDFADGSGVAGSDNSERGVSGAEMHAAQMKQPDVIDQQDTERGIERYAQVPISDKPRPEAHGSPGESPGGTPGAARMDSPTSAPFASTGAGEASSSKPFDNVYDARTADEQRTQEIPSPPFPPTPRHSGDLEPTTEADSLRSEPEISKHSRIRNAAIPAGGEGVPQPVEAVPMETADSDANLDESRADASAIANYAAADPGQVRIFALCQLLALSAPTKKWSFVIEFSAKTKFEKCRTTKRRAMASFPPICILLNKQPGLSMKAHNTATNCQLVFVKLHERFCAFQETPHRGTSAAPPDASSDTHNTQLALSQPIHDYQPGLPSGGSHSLDTSAIEVKQSWQNTASVSWADGGGFSPSFLQTQPGNATEDTGATQGDLSSPDARVEHSRCQRETTAESAQERTGTTDAGEF